MRLRSIRTKLVLVYLALAVPLAILLGFGLYDRYDDEIRSVYEEREDFALLTAANIKSFITGIVTSCDAAGHAIVDAKMSPEEASTYLVTVRNDNPTITNLSYVDTTGRIIASANKRVIGKDISNRSLIKNIISGKEFEISDFVKHMVGGYGFVVLVGVREGGKLLGIMVAVIEASKLDSVIPSLKDKDRGCTNIVDSKGMVIYNSEHTDMPVAERDWSRFSFIREALNGKVARTNSFICPTDKERHYAVEVPLKEFGWAAGSDIEADRALSYITEDAALAAPFYAMLFLVVSAFALAIGNTISEPVIALSRKARLIGEEKLDEPIEISSSDEIGILARELDSARVKLSNSFRSMSLLLDASSALSRSLDLKEVTATLSDILTKLLHVQKITVASFDRATNEIVLLSSNDPLCLSMGERYSIEELPSAFSELYATKTPITVNVEASSLPENEREFFVSRKMGSVLLYPLVIGDRAIGHLTIARSDQELNLSEHDMRLIDGVATQASVAVDNARLFTEISQERARFQDIFDHASDGIVLVDAATGQLLDANPAFLNMVGYGKDALLQKTIWELRDPVTVSLTDCPLEGIRGEGGGFIDVPLARGDTSVIDTEVNARSLVLDGRRVELLLIRDITERKRAENELRKALETTQNLLEVSEAIASNLELSAMLSELVSIASSLIGTEYAQIYLIDEVRDEVEQMTEGTSPDLPVGTRLKLSETGPFRDVFEGMEVVIASTAGFAPEMQQRLHDMGLAPGIGIPLIAKGKTIGGFFFAGNGTVTPISESKLELARGIARQAAIAIENAKLYEHEHDIAETLQQALLKVPDELPGVEIHHVYEASMGASRVGGDFYDLFEIERGKIGFVIGDVSGKGLEAATITSMVKSTIRGFAYRDKDAAKVMADTNNVVFRQIRANQFVTAIFGILNLESGRLEVVSAGHPDLIICTQQACEFLTAPRNLPLGTFTNNTFEKTSAQVSAGDTIILYTDGLIEAKNNGDLFGDERIIDVVGAMVPASPQEFTQRLVESAKAFSGGNLIDDVAIMSLRLK